MNKSHLLKKTEAYVKEKMSGEGTGHDWFHVDRVRRTALTIAKSEKDVDVFIIQVASLLHDLGDPKFNTSSKSEETIIQEACDALRFSRELSQEVLHIILNLSYSKNITKKKRLSREGQIVQDADRLDALGAIGIARAFAYGGKKNRELYNPEITPQVFTTNEAYQNAKSTTINHFYEKVFLLKKQLNTKSAKTLALKRERFMKEFLKEFYDEWRGKR